MSTNAPESAFPFPANEQNYQPQYGLTAIEYACIELRIPESGNEWLDKLIAKAERRDLAAKAMQGVIASASADGVEYAPVKGAGYCVECAAALQSELKKEQA